MLVSGQQETTEKEEKMADKAQEKKNFFFFYNVPQLFSLYDENEGDETITR